MAAFYPGQGAGSGAAGPARADHRDEWRQVVGYGAIFAIAAVIAVSVGTIVRQSAGAIAILLLWPLIIESLFTLIPTVGAKVGPWLPFAAADKIVAPSTGVANLFEPGSGPDALQGLLVFAGTGLVLWLIALVLLQKRDADARLATSESSNKVPSAGGATEPARCSAEEVA